MGCVQTKEICNEENNMILFEENLGYHLQVSTEVDSVFRKYSSNGYLNSAQFRRACNILGITSINTEESNKIEAFYQKLQNDKSLYPLKDLLVIGVLLSDGNARDKSRLLYEIYDEDNTGNLSFFCIKEQNSKHAFRF